MIRATIGGCKKDIARLDRLIDKVTGGHWLGEKGKNDNKGGDGRLNASLWLPSEIHIIRGV